MTSSSSPCRDFPELKIVFDTSPLKRAARYVTGARRTAATLTAHHLRNHQHFIFTGGIAPLLPARVEARNPPPGPAVGSPQRQRQVSETAPRTPPT